MKADMGSTDEERRASQKAIVLSVLLAVYFLSVSLLLAAALPFLYEEFPAFERFFTGWLAFFLLGGTFVVPGLVLLRTSKLPSFWPFFIYGPLVLLSVTGGSYLYFGFRVAAAKM